MPTHPAHLPPVIAHRGASGTVPENTLAAFARAAELGAEAVEMDVVLSADGIPVILHDADLARTTGGPGRVAETPFAEIRTRDAGAWFDAAFAGVRVPSLDEALACVADHRMALNLEIKPTPGRAASTAERAAEALARLWPRELGLVVSSARPASLTAFAAALPGVELGLITGAVPARWRARLAGLGCASLHVAHDRLTPTKVAAVSGAEIRLRAYTVNDPARAAELLDWGVDGIFTDFPERMAQVGGR